MTPAIVVGVERMSTFACSVRARFLAADFVGGIKFGALLKLRRYRRSRVVVGGQFAMTLDHYEDQIPIGCTSRLGRTFLR
ncbi:hypothetical protein QA645_32845 [Bradyrhizobium sp. CIAT3101]|uniref:hypothetical protein n=1 Tax=Bradyrhizobium sp. CIAT3101 TaxID=439387 RepID=UPI0024B04961|nr:hypothetical protein [Bradyrhizobium sp. CIAT3101]WFU79255.1 hypothetical protein QA645_32845 [Bradyrhizobium sp. CIAT3101]